MGRRGLSGAARRREEKWRIVSGELNSEWRIGMAVDRSIDQFISGPEGLAGRHDLSGGLLSIDASISSRRTVWIDVADQARGGVGSSQHCGRSRSGKYRQLRATSPNITGLFERAGNAPAFGGARRHTASAGFAAGSVRELGQNASCFDPVAAGEGREMKPLAIGYSLLATRHSLFAKARSAHR